MLTLKDIDNGGKKDVKLTFKRKPDGTPIDKKQPQKEVKEVSDFKNVNWNTNLETKNLRVFLVNVDLTEHLKKNKRR